MVTDKILSELIFHSRPETRCSAVIWLVSLLTYTAPPPSFVAASTVAGLSSVPPAAGASRTGLKRGRQDNRLLSLLPDIQDAFSQLLGDTNELTQVCAVKC